MKKHTKARGVILFNPKLRYNEVLWSKIGELINYNYANFNDYDVKFSVSFKEEWEEDKTEYEFTAIGSWHALDALEYLFNHDIHFKEESTEKLIPGVFENFFQKDKSHRRLLYMINRHLEDDYMFKAVYKEYDSEIVFASSVEATFFAEANSIGMNLLNSYQNMEVVDATRDLLSYLGYEEMMFERTLESLHIAARDYYPFYLNKSRKESFDLNLIILVSKDTVDPVSMTEFESVMNIK